MPAAQDLSWHLVYLQWTLAFFLLARVVADEPGHRWVLLDRGAVAIAGLTGPFSILFAPLYVWRRRRLGVTTWIVVACAAVQLVFLATAARTPSGGATVTEAMAVAATRMLVEPLLGFRVTSMLAEAGFTPIAWGALAALILTLLVVAATAKVAEGGRISSQATPSIRPSSGTGSPSTPSTASARTALEGAQTTRPP